MIRSLRIAALGMAAQQLNVDTISNNLANVNTTGYKKNAILSALRTKDRTARDIPAPVSMTIVS